jgi:hypothetical protein
VVISENVASELTITPIQAVFLSSLHRQIVQKLSPKKSLSPEKGAVSRSGAATFRDVEMLTTVGRADLTIGVNPERKETLPHEPEFRQQGTEVRDDLNH